MKPLQPRKVSWKRLKVHPSAMLSKMKPPNQALDSETKEKHLQKNRAVSRPA